MQVEQVAYDEPFQTWKIIKFEFWVLKIGFSKPLLIDIAPMHQQVRENQNITFFSFNRQGIRKLKFWLIIVVKTLICT